MVYIKQNSRPCQGQPFRHMKANYKKLFVHNAVF